MIPRDIEVIDRLVAAQFHECWLEFFSTNQKYRWILQLRYESKNNVAFLFTVEYFASFCVGFQQCIEAAINKSDDANMMINTISQDMDTNLSDQGAISMISSWDSEPNIQFNFYTDQNDRKSAHTLVYFLDDAVRLYNLFAEKYNSI